MIKALTGNNEVVTLLNRLGHSRSVTSMDEIETAWCIRKIEKQSDTIALARNILKVSLANLSRNGLVPRQIY